MKISECKDKIKVGDWVRTNGDGGMTGDFLEGEIGEIWESRFFVWQNKKLGGQGDICPTTKGYSCSWQILFSSPGEIEIITKDWRAYSTSCGEVVKGEPKRKKIMNKLSTFLERQLDAKTKKLYKAGLINGDLEPTERGDKELKAILFFANREALVKRAIEIIKEEKEEKK